jgi:hypothetical protein
MVIKMKFNPKWISRLTEQMDNNQPISEVLSYAPAKKWLISQLVMRKKVYHITKCGAGVDKIETIPTTGAPNKKEDPLLEAVRALYSEVNCRIQHGADSSGHLEYVESKLKAMLGIK